MITVAGLTPSLDLTYTVDTLTLGHIHRVGDVVRCAGGKALNMARAASTLGADCTVVAILGGPVGAMLQNLVVAEGMRAIVVESAAETRICVSVAAADSAQLTEIYQEAAPISDAVWQAFRSEIEAVVQAGSGWLSVSGRAPSGSAHVIAELVRLGRAAGVQVAVDTHAEALPQALTAGPALVKINRYEAAELLNAAPDTDLLTMARAIRTTSNAAVVLTDGAAGSVALDQTGAWQTLAPAVVGRYPVGSGDSFLGGLLATLDQGRGLDEALRVATACGVANALVPGQGHFSWESVSRIASEVQPRRVG